VQPSPEEGRGEEDWLGAEGGAGEGARTDAALSGTRANAAGSMSETPNVGHEQPSSAMGENAVRWNRVRVWNVPTVVPRVPS